MDGLDRWDLVILAVASLVAVRSLARLMARRRKEVMQRLHGQARRTRKAPPPAAGEDPGQNKAA